jgi:hypothetical protein
MRDKDIGDPPVVAKLVAYGERREVPDTAAQRIATIREH